MLKKRTVQVDVERLYTHDVGLLAPRLRIPSFQRGYVWSPADAVALFESIILGYPIGGLILWDPNGRNWGLSSGELIVLDGQQRLTTLAGSILQDGFGTAIRVVYDVVTDGFYAVDGDLASNQISLCDLADAHKVGRFWRTLLDQHPQMFRPPTPESEIKNRRRALWAKIAPGVTFPRDKATRKAQGALLTRLFEAEIADEKERNLAWYQKHPEHELAERLDFVEKRLREHQTAVTVIRGGTLTDIREIFRRINSAGRPLDEAGIVALLSATIPSDVAPNNATSTT